MYYHSVVEILPRIIALLEVDPSIKILTSGTEFERSYLNLLGVTDDQIVPFDPTVRYYAKELLYPTPTSRIAPGRVMLMIELSFPFRFFSCPVLSCRLTPPDLVLCLLPASAKELIEKTRVALGVQDLPEEERDLIIFASRENDLVRKVENEDEIIAALQATFPEEKIVKFDGTKDARANIELFKRAKAVVGPHGAGLSHIIFSAPGTKVVEFIFMADPVSRMAKEYEGEGKERESYDHNKNDKVILMSCFTDLFPPHLALLQPLMFWHLANALQQEYWMLPIPYSFWLQEKMNVPMNDVKQILLIALGAGKEAACPDGFTLVGSNCAPCPQGTYRLVVVWRCLGHFS